MSTFSPESSFSLNSGQNFRLAVVFNPFHTTIKKGDALGKVSHRSGSERDYPY